MTQPTHSDLCHRDLRLWIETQWPHLTVTPIAPGVELTPADAPPPWQPLAGDAGFRRYFRLPSEPPLLAVHSPPQTEPNAVFLRLAEHLRRHGVLAPAVLAVDMEKGFLLLQDLGPSLLRDVLNEETVEGLYAETLMCLLRLQQSSADASSLALPDYDRVRLRQEMNLFIDWFVPQLLGHTLTDAERRLLDAWFRHLEDNALSQPKVLVHRDFHSRNLVHRDDGPPGVIDFQDAVMGPVTYDLVSLLRDCYIRWPEEQVRRWALCYANIAVQVELIPPVSEAQFLRWFDGMGLQRHIKVLGIFARLSLRDGKHGYLQDLPLVIEYTLSVARRYPEGAAFAEWFDAVLMPRVQAQPWWAARTRSLPA